MKKRNVAIVLAAGQGKRMNSSVPKQYLLLGNRPVLFYALDTFQKCELIDEIILVVAEGQISYCREEIVDKYHFTKVGNIVEGGSERYLSVSCGIKEAKDADIIFIHDGARPFITNDILTSLYDNVVRYNACVVGVPVKDTIKIADKDGFVNRTPDRNLLWAIQTPQVFQADLVKEAYKRLSQSSCTNITDDAMVVEQMMGVKVKLVMGDYRNIKITTPEDLEVGETFIK